MYLLIIAFHVKCTVHKVSLIIIFYALKIKDWAYCFYSIHLTYNLVITFELNKIKLKDQSYISGQSEIISRSKVKLQTSDFTLVGCIVIQKACFVYSVPLKMPVRDDRKNKDLHLEEKHVYNVYDQIATKFSEISQKAWPNVRRFLKELPPGSIVADIGKNIQLQYQKIRKLNF